MEETINSKARKQASNYFRDVRRDDCGRDRGDNNNNGGVCNN
jgi:hypothetical protein